MNVVGLLGILLTFAAPQEVTTPAPGTADVYVIYSIMVGSYKEALEDPTVAIAPRTTPPMGNQSPCPVPPPQYASRWDEILADFAARKDKPLTLVRDLNIPKPYIFVTDEENAAFVATRPGPPLRNPTPLPPVPQRLQGVIHIIRLGDVYFSKDRTLALTGIGNYCGPLCAKAEWKIYERQEGRWVEVRPVRSCMMVA